MPVTEEPRGLNWINNINTNAFGSLTTQTCWFIGSTALTFVACYLMTREDTYEAVGAVIEGTTLRQMVMHSRETMRQLGNGLALALLAAWGFKTGAGVVDSQNKRKANPAYAEVVKAETEAKITSTAAALALKEAAKDTQALRDAGISNLTVERPAIKPPNGETVEEPAWADGKQGIL